jgi:hypothetical protein
LPGQQKLLGPIAIWPDGQLEFEHAFPVDTAEFGEQQRPLIDISPGGQVLTGGGPHTGGQVLVGGGTLSHSGGQEPVGGGGLPPGGVPPGGVPPDGGPPDGGPSGGGRRGRLLMGKSSARCGGVH